MSTPGTNLVVLQPAMAWPIAAASVDQGQQLLWTVTGTQPVVIESVYLAFTAPMTALTEFYVLRLIDVSGNVIASSPSAELNSNDIDGPGTAEMTWARGYQGFGDDYLVRAGLNTSPVYFELWVNMPLPDVTLAPQSTLTLQRVVISAGDAISISPIVVTYSYADTASQVADATGPFMLVPGPGA